MRENLYLELALKLNSKEFPSLLLKLNRGQKVVYFALQLAGYALGKVLFSATRCSNWFVDLISKAQAKTKQLPQLELSQYSLAKEFLQQHPKTAVLFLVSHPLTTPEQAPLLAQMLCACRQVSQYLDPRKKFLLVHAVDQFALDALPWPLSGFYSGLVLSRHIAVHRNPQELNALERWVWKNAQHHQTIFKMIRTLKKGHFVFAAPAGGIAPNARIFYTVKEWAFRVYKENKLQVKGLRKSVFAFDFARAIFDQNNSVRSQAALSSSEKEKVLNLLTLALGDVSLAQNYCAQLDAEMQLETPLRARLFKILVTRVASGQTLLLIPIRHGLPAQIKAELPAIISARSPMATVQQLGTKTELSIEQFILNCLQPL